MKLYYAPGVCSLASHIALSEAGAEYTLEKTDLKTKKTESGDDYLRVNPKGYVPALKLDSGDVLTEGPAILQYIADTNKDAKLAPENGTVARAHVNALLNYTGAELHKSFKPFFSSPAVEGEERKQAADKVLSAFQHIERTLEENGDYLTGDAFTIADAYVFVVSNWTDRVGIDLSGMPKLQEFRKRVAARDAVKKAMSEEGLL